MSRTRSAKVKAPWGVDGGSSTLNQAACKFERVKPAWVNGSSVLLEEEERNKNMPKYELKSPWEPGDEDIENEFDKRIAAENFTAPTAPWDKQEFSAPELPQKEYKFQSMFEPLPMSESRLKQIREYEYNPPFTTEQNAHKSSNKEGDHVRSINKVQQQPTRAPWAYGELEDVNTAHGKKQIKKPIDTSLWSLPEDMKKKDIPLDSSGDPILDKLRQKLKESGAYGIFGLSRKFRIMDDNGSGALDFLEFTKAIQECRLELSKQQLKHLFLYFDTDDSGTISYDEFLVGIRGVLNPRRRAMVQMAFNVLDKDGSGVIDMDDIVAVYDASKHPEVIARKKTVDQVLREFIDQMDVGCDKDGIITPLEFERYYAGISASIDSDDYFELMIRNAWHISGGEGACANTTNRRVLVTHADGTQTVEEIKDDIGMVANDQQGMMDNLQTQGISATKLASTYGANPNNRSMNNYRATATPASMAPQQYQQQPPAQTYNQASPRYQQQPVPIRGSSRNGSRDYGQPAPVAPQQYQQQPPVQTYNQASPRYQQQPVPIRGSSRNGSRDYGQPAPGAPQTYDSSLQNVYRK